jgi:hypothetical protein
VMWLLLCNLYYGNEEQILVWSLNLYALLSTYFAPHFISPSRLNLPIQFLQTETKIRPLLPTGTVIVIVALPLHPTASH